MLRKPYKKGNRFSQYCSIADAAVEWQGLTEKQIELVLVDQNGMPFLADVQDLADRAEAILEAAQERKIEGHTHSEDGDPRLPHRMLLLRDSVYAWIAQANKRMSRAAPTSVMPQHDIKISELFSTEEICARLKCSRSTLIRKINCGDFPEATHPSPGGNKWLAEVVLDYMAGKQGRKITRN